MWDGFKQSVSDVTSGGHKGFITFGSMYTGFLSSGGYLGANPSIGFSYFNKGIGYAGLGYTKLGYRMFGDNWFNVHPRITVPGLGEEFGRGFGFGQFDASHRSATFFRPEALGFGQYGVRNWNTDYINFSPGGTNFSWGINPWTRTIHHEGPGIMK